MLSRSSVFVVLFISSTSAQMYPATTFASSFNMINIPMNSCTADSQCAYLTNATYGYSNACCATWKSQAVTGGPITTLGNGCIDQDTDFYAANFTTPNATTNVWFNCTLNATWANYVPATW